MSAYFSIKTYVVGDISNNYQIPAVCLCFFYKFISYEYGIFFLEFDHREDFTTVQVPA